MGCGNFLINTDLWILGNAWSTFLVFELRKNFRWTAKFATLLVGSLIYTHAISATENDAMILFDAICLSTDADMELIEKMAAAHKAKPIPKEVLLADQAMARDGGKGYIFKINKSRLIVMATSKKACTVLAQNVSSEVLKNLILNNYPLSKYHEDASGTQIMTMYKINPPSKYKSGVINLNITKQGFGADNSASLGFLPGSVINQYR